MNRKLETIFVAAILLSILVAQVPTTVAGTDYPTTSVTIHGNNTSVTLTLDQLKAMSYVEKTASYQNQLGFYSNEGLYRGVRISDLLAMIGGIDAGETITVWAKDGYSQYYGYENAYNTDKTIQGDMVLAYEFNGESPPTWVDGMRIAFLPDDGKYSTTDMKLTTNSSLISSDSSAGSRWVKYVEHIATSDSGFVIPEFEAPQAALVLFILVATLLIVHRKKTKSIPANRYANA